jgi:hypothetical protein
MAARGWANSTVTAIGVSAGAGAAQLGVAYGLGIVVWQPVTGTAGESQWLASLAWVLWIAATSTVLGAVYANGVGARVAVAKAAAGPATDDAPPAATANRSPRPPGGVVDVAWRTAVALAAAIGAAITVPLVMLPARAAHRADNFQPQVTAGAYAVVGIIGGLIIAIAAVNARVVAINVLASAGWVWALAVVSVIDSVRADRTVGTAQLAAWHFTDRGWFGQTLYLPGALLMLGGALLVGVFASLPADRRGENRVGIAVSGAVGPLLVAGAYFLAAPRLTVRADQLSAYLFAPYAVIAGLAGSVLVAALGPLRPGRTRPATAPVASTARSATVPAGTPPKDDSADADLAEWTRNLAAPEGTGEKKPEPAGTRPDPTGNVRKKAGPSGDETTLRLDAGGSGPRTQPRGESPTRDLSAEPNPSPAVRTHPSPEPGAAGPAGTGKTGRATVTEPLWPEKPKPRKGRGPRGGNRT